MGKNKKTHKLASRENYFALKSGYDQHTNPILNGEMFVVVSFFSIFFVYS